MRLRIFEPRYKRMVTACLKNNTGFGVCLISNNGHGIPKNVSSVGTLVSIIDFETLPDGMLGITVTGMQKFNIRDVKLEQDGLRIANVDWLENWAPSQLQQNHLDLQHRLQQVFEEFPEMGELYSHRFFDDAAWVSQRWLEMLPIECEHFELLVSQQDCRAAVEFLNSAFHASDSIPKTKH
ncbi:hypothetical protein VHP8226_02100 [Vibrio hippocampi]|uniref:Lon N-terminal domain-containing protein n=2 Tax=Vibrio hippocampi TaxID=654686 RepID=A0ABN8DIC5_9VIBR|nr:hypothetical protein VHP8226_02100 [Vibrio hippocampi]